MKRKMFLSAALIVLIPAILISAYPEVATTLGEAIVSPEEEISENEMVTPLTEEENLSVEEMVDYELVPLQLDKEDLFSFVTKQMRANGFYYDEIKSSLEKYISALEFYHPSEDEKAYLINMLNKGYDFNKIMDIYNFLQLTDKDISIVEDIYTIMESSPLEISIEDAYANYTNTTADELTISNVAYYVDNGISPEEIVLMYELMLKGNKNVRTALNEYVDGKTWSDIVSEAYSLPADAFGADATLHEIAHVKNIAQKTGNLIENILTVDDGKPVISAEAQSEYATRLHAASVEKSILNESQNFDVLIFEEAEQIAPGISAKQLSELQKEDYSLREIAQASAIDAISFNSDEKLVIDALKLNREERADR